MVPELFGDPPGVSVQVQFRLVIGSAQDFDLSPADITDAASQGFGRGFFGGKASSQ